MERLALYQNTTQLFNCCILNGALVLHCWDGEIRPYFFLGYCDPVICLFLCEYAVLITVF